MRLYRDQILPRLTDVVMRRDEFTEIRARVVAGLDGVVLEIGFGSGLNVPLYPPTVRRLLAVDPATVGRKLANGRVAAGNVPVEYIGLDASVLALEEGSIDHAVTTWTLCSIPDVQRALSEIYRVLRPGGTYHFVEHGRSPDTGVARWQDRLTPVQRLVAGGCHLNRPIDDLIAGSGLRLARLDNYYLAAPKAFGYTFEGVATKDA